MSYFASFMYDFELMGHDATARGDVYHKGKEIFRTENNLWPTPTSVYIPEPEARAAPRQLRVGVHIKNVNDTIAPYAIGDSGYHGFNPPQSFGVEFSYSR